MKRLFIRIAVGLLLLWNAFLAGSIVYAHVDEMLHDPPLTSVFVDLSKTADYAVNFHNEFSPRALVIYCYSPTHNKYKRRAHLQELLASEKLEIELRIVDHTGREIYREAYIPFQIWDAKGRLHAAQYLWWPDWKAGPKKLHCKVKSTLPNETVPIDCRIVFQPFVEFIPVIIHYLWIVFSASLFVTLILAWLYRKQLLPQKKAGR
ncbi:hypothetical protein P0136_01610 [Lentisphaerota bacterium ZTH]|nr:hypothetical protein JYG24_07250 [Lentisphaerota bacterium]WET06709.1 hypothetical protein P0136_01610 [Lentisphaerota bacterium ZTH]